MRTLDEAVEDALAQLGKGSNDSALGRLTLELVDSVLSHSDGELRKAVRKSGGELLKEDAAQLSAFVRRNRRRWKRPLDELRLMIAASEEMGRELVAEWNAGERNDPYMFCALNHLFVQSLVCLREMLCLMEGGFADGALARWRTLHELSVLASFLCEADEHVAERFVASFDFKAHRVARAYNQHSAATGLVPIPADELQEMEDTCNQHARKLGPRLGAEFGWAWPKLEARSLEDLELATGLEHWRPRYRWACQVVHGGFRPPGVALGLAESKVAGHLTGPSNGGMVDPIQMGAASFAITATMFLTHWPGFGRLLTMKLVGEWCRAVGPLALKVEAESLRRGSARRSKIADRFAPSQ